MSEQESDRQAIIELIHRNRIAIWTNDFDLWDSCFVHADYMTRIGWWRGGGPYLLRGWAENSRRLRANYPPIDLGNAYKTTIEDLSLQIRGDTAWATFVQQYPNHIHIPDHIGPGRRLETRVFERHGGEWKIALLGVLDNDAGQTGTASLRLDESGRVLWQSNAGAEALAADDDLTVKAGILHFRNRSLDHQLHEALVWTASINTGYQQRNGARPIVAEGGEGLPTKIYWIIADSGMIQFSFAQQQLDGRRLEIAAAIYGLSPAQITLAALVAEGLSLPEIAERMGVTPNTARTHLNRIFDKVGVRTQPSLVRVLLMAVAPL
jgi:DNA-binding CsgD family transcriptional regulator